MQAKIKSLHLDNFKGVKSATYQFGGKNASAIGQNGAGKTTIFTAYMWLMVDKDSDLKSNPNIRPLDAEECAPRVEVVFEIDGKEVTAAKIQKCTVKKSKTGGVDTVSLSNSYEVNSVEYGERDFKKKMSEYGFDFDLFLPLSHPDVFTSQKSADMRKVLFGMTSEKSDKEIADLTEGAEDVAEMLANYTADEVKAMQNATLRKIREDYGKDGEILRAKIEGMGQSKTDIDVAELKLLKNSLNEQIAENKAKQEDISKEFEEQKKASDGILELKFELSDLERKENQENEKRRKAITGAIIKTQKKIYEKEREIFEQEQREIRIVRIEMRLKNDMEECKSEWAEKKRLVFTNKILVCPCCGREYSEEKKEQLREEFEKKRDDDLLRIAETRNKIFESMKTRKKERKNKREEIEKLKKTLSDLVENLDSLHREYKKIPQCIDISDRPEAKEIQRQIAEKEFAMNRGGSAEEIRQQLKEESEGLQKQMDVVNGDLALAQKNVEIDEQIEALRKKQSEFEQNRANAEKILYQLDLVSKRKNELLTDQVNSHFKLVKFRLFDYLKNGNVVDDCEPTIDGKSLKDHSNGALRVLAKLDIVDGLQRFYGQHYPVFAEDFSLVTENTGCRIDMDCQLIKLVAEKGVKELKIEVEG